MSGFKRHRRSGACVATFTAFEADLLRSLAGQLVGVRQVSERIWLVTFMDYDLGYFDDETCRLEPIENPFQPKVLPMSPERSVTYVSVRSA